MSKSWMSHLNSFNAFNSFRALWNLKEKLFNSEEKKGARVYDIAYRHNLDTICMPSSLDYFCLKFKRMAPLSAIMDENVYLYCYDSKEVAFVVVDPDKEIWRSEYGTFFKTAQFEHAQQIIKISFEEFFAVCEDLPNPGSRLNFVHFVPRSGSTLLIQMFEETGQCISVSEPEDFIPVPEKLRAGITHEEKVQLFRAIGKYIARGVNENAKYKWYFAKVNAPRAIPFLDVMKDSFPESKHIFLYRDFKATLKSSFYTFDHFPFFKVIEGMVKYVPNAGNKIRKQFLDMYTYSGQMSTESVDEMKSLWYKYKPNTGFIIYGYCGSYDFFLNKQNLPAIKYDDLVANKQENTKRILEHFELPVDLVEKAVKAMDNDSQRNSSIAKKRIGNKAQDGADLEDEVKMLAEDFCKLFNIPGLKDDQRHMNTITLSPS